LLVSGGVSAGTTDLVPPTLRRLGAEVLFHAVAVKPGKPLLFARRGETLIFGLPGNPVSVQVAFRLFARPCLLAMQGARPSTGREIPVRLTAPLSNHSGRRAYAPVRVRIAGHELLATPVASRGSADLVAHAAAEALAILEAGRTTVHAGETLTAVALPAFLEPETGQ
jgi:molybdopterin molybdotransferase